MKWNLLGAIAALTLLANGAFAQTNQTQTIPLAPGWNLVAFQVAPTNTSPEAVFGSLGNDFVAAWTMDNSTKEWSRYARPGSAEAVSNPVSPMGAISLGRAYWVYMNSQVNWNVAGVPPLLTPGVTLTNGWNLIGIPTGKAILPEPVNMLSVLTAAGFDYDVILKWEQGLYKKFTPADTDVDDFTVFDPNKGHWVHVKSASAFNLQPHAISSVRADVDVEPQGNYPSFEDFQISTSTTPLGPQTQTHIVFLPDEDSQQIAVANTGGGILAWELVWTPQDATNANWLQFSAASGITTIETDAIQIHLDRTRLPKGTYKGSLLLRTTAGNRTFQVVANVPEVRGEWRGVAQIATVNGRKNRVADIDLHMDFFEDPTIPGLIRGLLDSRNSLLWPVDVPLIGHSGSLSENRFSLGGAYILPPGDQNNPPYDKFGPTEAQDIDWNCNGLLDDLNPFPFPIYRSVLLQGALVSSSSAEGMRISGTYTESVYGMMRTPIRMEGTFELRRENPIPFTNRRPIANQESTNGTSPVVLRAFQPATPAFIPVGKTTNILSFATDLVLQKVLVGLDFSDAPANGVKFTLQSPEGQQVILHNQANIATLRGLSFPALRKPVQSLDAFVNGGALTKGDWKLIIENSSGVAGKLYQWSLQLQGQAVFSVAGRIQSAAGTGLPAQVSLDGLPITSTTLANADGSFRFDRLPGIPANFTASFPGFEPPDPSQPGLSNIYTIPMFASAACISPARTALIAKFRPLPAMPVPSGATEGFGSVGVSTNPVVIGLKPRSDLGTALTMLSSPSIGPGPLSVQFTLTGNAAALPAGANISWTFGDGGNNSTSGIGLTTVEHVYTTPSTNGYLAVATVAGTSVTNRIIVMPSPNNAIRPLNFFQVYFTGGGTIPTNLALNITGSYPPDGPAPFADLVMIQHADCASFDIDRAPYTTTGDRNFHHDGFTNGVPSINSADYQNGFKGEDYNYQVSLAQWSSADQCGYILDDDFFNPHPKQGATGPCLTPRYRMVCNIGPQIVPPANAEVQAVPSNGPSPTFFPTTPDPLLIAQNDQIAKARDLRLITGPLAADWKK